MLERLSSMCRLARCSSSKKEVWFSSMQRAPRKADSVLPSSWLSHSARQQWLGFLNSGMMVRGMVWVLVGEKRWCELR